jgi:hypothetical protein
LGSLKVNVPNMKVFLPLLAVKVLMLSAASAFAHASQQSFVLLLPTGAWTTAGVAVVALTVLVLVVIPDARAARLFRAVRCRRRNLRSLETATSLTSSVILACLIWIGLTGPRDPLSNLMPLGFWTILWIGLLSLAGLVGGGWRFLNPWTGLARLLSPTTFRPWPRGLACWPALAGLILFTAFLLADPAPDDPARLARLAALYWLCHLCGTVVFGPIWLQRAEFLTLIFTLYGRLTAFGRAGIGWPGWQIPRTAATPALGLFALALLAAGSFDGLNETFLWLAWIGVNPLEFPGRSAVVASTLAGLGLSLATLCAAFLIPLVLGLWMSGRPCGLRRAFGPLALTILPIAWAYHVAHYLTTWMVSSQYTLAALSDPFATGADWLGIAPFYVSTGFFNQIGPVRAIWLTQAGVVVLGHIWSVLLAHRVAVKLAPAPGQAVRLTLPLSIFMIAYTFAGLWLLAAPRGV